MHWLTWDNTWYCFNDCKRILWIFLNYVRLVDFEKLGLSCIQKITFDVLGAIDGESCSHHHTFLGYGFMLLWENILFIVAWRGCRCTMQILALWFWVGWSCTWLGFVPINTYWEERSRKAYLNLAISLEMWLILYDLGFVHFSKVGKEACYMIVHTKIPFNQVHVW